VKIPAKFQKKYPDITVPNISVISRLRTCFYKRGSVCATMTVHSLLPPRLKKLNILINTCCSRPEKSLRRLPSQKASFIQAHKELLRGQA